MAAIREDKYIIEINALEAAMGNPQQQDVFLDQIAALTDPNADRILFWDDSVGAFTFLTPGTNLTITGTTIDAAGGGGAPASTVTNETTYGITPAVGVGTDYARNDHTHGTMATPTKTTVGLGNVLDVVQEAAANKDASGGYVGLTLLRINFKNALGTFTSFLKNTNTASRVYEFADRDGIIADDTDLQGKQATLVSGTNIKTINGSTLLGAGNVSTVTAFTGLSDVPASYATHSLKTVRVNVGETALEFYVPANPLTIGNAVAGGGINRVLYEDGSQNLAASANLQFAGTFLEIESATTTDLTMLKLDNTAGYAINSERRIDFESGGVVYGRIANYYVGSSIGLKFYTAGSMVTPALELQQDRTAIFGGNVTLNSGLTVKNTVSPALTVENNEAVTTSRTTLLLQHGSGLAVGAEWRVDFQSSGTVYSRIAAYLNASSAVGLKFYTNGSMASPALQLDSNGDATFRAAVKKQEYDASNYLSTTISATGGVTFDAVGAGAAFTFSDPVTINGALTLSAQNIVTDTTTGMKIGTAGGAAGQKLAFFGSTPIVQPLLATGAGATVDNVITALQNLGLVRQT